MGIFYRKQTAHLPWRQRLTLEKRAAVRADRMESRDRIIRWAIRAMAVMHVLGLVAIYTIGVTWVWLLLAALLVVQFWIMRIGQRHSRSALRQLMREKRIRPAHCFECDYDLRGSTSATCPECGCDLGTADDSPPARVE